MFANLLHLFTRSSASVRDYDRAFVQDVAVQAVEPRSRRVERALLIDDRLARRKESLLKQYAAMETALGKLQTASQSVTALLNAQSSNNG